MAMPSSDTAIGKVTQAILVSTTLNGDTEETSIITATSKLKFNENYTYDGVKNMFRAIANCSTNTYQDSIVITRWSVNEILAQ